MFPAAIKPEVSRMECVRAAPFASNTTKLARNAPRRMPGQTRYPKSRINARAIPEGGHTGVALVFSNASSNPSLAAP